MKHGSVLSYIEATFLVAALVFPLLTTSAGRISQGYSTEHAKWPTRRRSSYMGRVVTVPVSDNGAVRGAMKKQINGEQYPLEIAGSRLPDCSHACGSCTPCRLKIVSSLCPSQSETCPISYKCMCNNKYYPVP